MATEKKVKIVEDLQETISRSSFGIVTDYRGLGTTESNEIRRKVREAEGEYRVVKNSLAQIAAKNAGMDHIIDTLKGPVALVLGYGEAPALAKDRSISPRRRTIVTPVANTASRDACSMTFSRFRSVRK